ncbi:MAG: TolC family protein [Gemmatimonadota bacterium]|nr:TolC family protein [Gemmatimonadota bacterium]
MIVALHSRTALAAAMLALALGTRVAAQTPADTGAALTLDRAVALALEAHPAVQSARAAEDEAAAQVGEATAQWLPQLSARAMVTRFQEPMLVFPLHELDVGAFPDFNRTLLQGGLDLGWLLFDGGGRRSRIRSAKARARLAEAGTATTTMELVTSVTGAYVGVLSAAGVVEALDDNLAALAAERDRVQRMLDEGSAARVELLRVEAALAQAEAERITTAARLDAVERSLARLLTLDPAETRSTRLRPVVLGDSSLAPRAILLAQLEATNPDVLRAERNAETAEWAHRAARAAWFPRLDAVGSYGMWGSAAGEYVFEWQVGMRLSYPLFTGGARASAVSGARARAAYAREQARLVRLQEAEALDRALSSLEEQRARAVAVARAVAQLAEVARIEQLALETGAGTQTEYLRAQADLRRARASLVEARYAEIVARLELARSTGELSPAWLTTILETQQ